MKTGLNIQDREEKQTRKNMDLHSDVSGAMQGLQENKVKQQY